MTDNVFDQSTPAAAATDTPPNPGSVWIGEGKKYKDQGAMDKGMGEANDYISGLQSEMAELRDQLGTLAKTEDVLKAIEQSRTPEAAETPAMSEGSVQELVRKQLEASQRQTSAAANLSTASSKLVEHAGGVEEAKALLISRAQELGVSVDYLQDQAKASPEAFAATVGINRSPAAAKAPEGAPTGSVNTEAMGSSTGAKDKAYFDNLLRTDKKAYFAPAVQNEYHKLVASGQIKL